MSDQTLPLPGDYFVSGTGFGTSFVAGFQARAVRWGTYTHADKGLKPKVNHAGIYVGKVNGVDSVVEAMPGGAILTPVTNYLDEHTLWSNGKFITPEHDRDRLAHLAINKLGTPYGWGDIVALSLAQKRGPSIINPFTPYVDQPWWVQRLINPAYLTCGQLVDQVYFEDGIHLFNDGRIQGLVSPADIHKLLVGVN